MCTLWTIFKIKKSTYVKWMKVSNRNRPLIRTVVCGALNYRNGYVMRENVWKIECSIDNKKQATAAIAVTAVQRRQSE